MSRISPGTLLLAVIAVASGLLGAYLVRENLKVPPEQQEVAEAEVVELTVPLASTDLKAGRTVTIGDIAVYRLTRAQLDELGVTEAFMNNTQQIIGRTLKQDIVKGSIFQTEMMYPEGTGPSVAELLEPGKRAITVPVELDAAVAGFATPGSWVDVVFRSDEQGERDSDDGIPSVAITLLERVKVLAVEEEVVEGTRNVMMRDNSPNAAVTLQVDPDQATALRLVDGQGTLALSLRHPDDELSYTRQVPLTMDELLNIPRRNRHEIEVFRGNRVSRVEFEENEDRSQLANRVADRDDNTNNSDEQVDRSPQQDAAAGGGGGGGGGGR